ncbi:MAG: MmgE/PrpD family protein [Oscillospiraceae bacterium]
MGQTAAFLTYLQEKSISIPEEVMEKAKDCLCDYLAVTFAGAATNRSRWASYLKQIGSGTAPVLGYDCGVDSKSAALINGFNAHSLELDDGQRFAMIHLGGSIVSALLAAKSENPMSNSDLLRGIVMGYEAACRLSIAMQPSHKKCGFHTAGTCGTVGAAMGVAFAQNMGFQQLKTVLTTALAGATGLLEIQKQASELKPYNIGRAAMDGLSAAYMGFTDFLGPDDMLNGERGFMKLFCQNSNPEKLTEKTNYYEIERIYVKPYAACRHCHSAIEAALLLREKIPVESIRQVEVETYHLAVKGHDHTDIAGTASAKLSIPYSVAAALILGRADISAFDLQNVGREDILALTQKVKILENSEFTKESPAKRIAKMTVFCTDGRAISHQVDYAKGDPENPMSREEIVEKAYALAGGQAEKIVTYVYKTN